MQMTIVLMMKHFVRKLKEGNFDYTQKGTTGRSEGCVVIEKKTDYQFLRSILKNSEQVKVPGIELKAYGRLVVR